VTPANVLDWQVLENICSPNSMIFMDKLYDTKKSYQVLKANNSASGIIQKNNNRVHFQNKGKELNIADRQKYCFNALLKACATTLKKQLRFYPRALEPSGSKRNCCA